MVPGKRTGDTCTGQQASPPISPTANVLTVTVAVIKSQATVVKGEVGGIEVDIMLDSGSSVSLVRCDLLSTMNNVREAPQPKPIQLVTASGDQLPILQHIRTSVHLSEFNMLHSFVMVESLVTPVILGIDFLQQNGLILDFTCMPVAVRRGFPNTNMPIEDVALAKVVPIYEEDHLNEAHLCAIQSQNEFGANLVDECAIPDYKRPPEFDIPKCNDVQLEHIVDQFKAVFCTTPGKTDNAYHFISTTGNPVRVPPRRIPAQYRAEVIQQIEKMLEQGIIIRSKSPWMAPAVFVPKKSGQIRMCCLINGPQKTHIHYRYQTRYKTGLLGPQSFQPLIYTVGTGKCQLTQ